MIATPLYSIRLNLRLKAELEAIAIREDRTVSYIIDKALTEYVAAQKKRPRNPTK